MWLWLSWMLTVSVITVRAKVAIENHELAYYQSNSNERILDCDDARLKCMYRNGCGTALQHYVIGCSTVTQNQNSSTCPELCQNALIALTSTEEGEALIKCRCSDKRCETTKKRIEICRPKVVEATRSDTIVSCHVAQLICEADAICGTALSYYNRFCRSMFHGKRCSYRCMNSILILERQEKATKLKTCRCNGKEDYDCARIQTNMARLCFNRTEMFPVHKENEIVVVNSGENAGGSGGGGYRGTKNKKSGSERCGGVPRLTYFVCISMIHFAFVYLVAAVS